MDPIADMIIRIKNASMAGLPIANIPYSRMKHDIATVLEREGYVASVTKRAKKARKHIEIGIKYEGTKPRIHDVDRVSKPSRRVYVGVKDMHSVQNGHGSLILSTPKGIMTDKEARKNHTGGEALFIIY
ncbi:MAG: 30S ribosomal protein S8 [Candidatus Yonathbacteria bacterium]|nr:30S ribosomal protein S8 [Candidatus Yonathbacteria bacterium]NTW47515.1 30S ribosomal protein S8 [Candidatus Yonathbacteria bacterium]